MRKIDPAAILRLPLEKQREARALLEELEKQYDANPLLRYEPHKKQIEFHQSHMKLKAFLGGNRSGKTTAGILDDIIQCVDRDCLPAHLLPFKKFDPPFHCRIVVPGEDVLFAVVFQKFREWCPKAQLVGDRFDKAYEKSRGILHFKNGSFIDFFTFGQELDKFGGTAKHRLHYDEEPPRAIRMEGKMRLADYKGADEIFTMTPQHGMDWMYDEIWVPWEQGTLKNAQVVVVSMDDNPYLDPEQRIAALEGYSREELEARQHGRFVHFHGMIYPEFSREKHIIPETKVPKDAKVYVGIDPGIRHMAAVVWTYVTPDDRMVVFDELGLQGYTVAKVAEAIKLVNAKHGTTDERGNIVPLQPRWYVIDPSARNIVHQTGRSDQMEFTDHGIITILGQNSVTAGINRIKERLQSNASVIVNGEKIDSGPRLTIMANCNKLVDQFRKYRWATPTRLEGDSKEKPVKSDDHLLDALRYVVASRPTRPQIQEEEEDRNRSPIEKLMHDEMSGKMFNRQKYKPVRINGIPV